MGVLPTADGYINVGVGGEGQWRSFCKAIDREDLLTHPDYVTMESRFKHRPQLRAVLEPIFTTMPSAHWLDRLQDFHVPVGPIYKMDEMFADPQVRHVGIAQTVTHPVRGEIELIGQPVTLSRTPATLVAAMPDKGGQTDEVLAEFGFSAAEIASMKEKKVV